MTSRIRFVKLSGILMLTAVTLVIALALFLPALLDVNAYRDTIVDVLQKALNRRVSFSSGTFAWHFGPSFVLTNCSVTERDGSTGFISSERVTVQLALLPLLQKRVEIRKLLLDSATVSLIRQSDGSLNINDLVSSSTEGGLNIQLKGLRINHGTFVWHDLALQKKGEPSVTATNMTLVIDNLARSKKGKVKLSCDIPSDNGPSAHISLAGSVNLPAKGKSLMDTDLHIDVDIRNGEISRFWQYGGRFVPFGDPGGRASIKAAFKGTLNEFSSKGSLTVSGATVRWPTVFHATLAPPAVQLEYAVKLSPQLIDVSLIDATVPGLKIKGSVQIQDYRSKDPRITAKASTPAAYRYEEIRNYIPFGIIEKDAADYIEHKIKAGFFRLESVALDGRLSQISHMEIEPNHNTLTLKATVEKGVLSYGPKAPTFNTLKGILELKGKNFNLVGMSGNFGTSPFKLDGSISEYNTNAQSDYPVKMEIAPQPAEVAWLSRIAGIPQLEYVHGSALKLSGSGHYSAYKLNGNWVLDQSSYFMPGAIRKPVGMANHLTFSAVIGNRETRLTALSYSLMQLALSGTATLGYGKQPFLGFELHSNTFPLNEALPIFLSWQQYRPRGTLQAHITGSGNPEDYSSMDYGGTIRMTGMSFQPGEKFKPLSGVNGTVSLQGKRLETSTLTVRYGSSLLTMSGTVTNLKKPEADVVLTSPEFFLRDTDLLPERSMSAVKRLHARFSLYNGSYTFKSISGLLNESNFNIAGSCSTGHSPLAVLAITSTKLDVNDLLMLFTLRKPEPPSPAAPHGIDAHLNLSVTKGTCGKLPFQTLNAHIQREKGAVTLQNLTVGLFGGKLSAKGNISPAVNDPNHYNLTFDANSIDAEKLLTTLDISRGVTGSLTLRGDLAAQGSTVVDIKKSAAGTIHLQLSHGKLRKFNTLSKVFSILNISQLLKFQLPDMVSGGMPYNSINGTFAVKGGRISSEDLFIKSDAINISIIGSADIVKEELNLTMGVQPLQTVDKIVNRIPIVGWLLTGKDKGLLTAYFEAKGKWSDPHVSAIPVKSMGKGLFNIFRRVFELPVRLFTDTGEVILGQ